MLLPIGSVEGHGAHLPVSTDYLIASHVSDELAARNGWVSLPPVTYSIAVPSRIGNVGISQDAFGGYLVEVIQHFVDFGQRRLILILGHGGPDMKGSISATCEALCRDHPITIQVFHILRVLEDLGLVDQGTDRHAGEWETSLMLHIQCEIVGEVDVYEGPEDNERLGVFGNPKTASKSKGRQHLDRLIGHIEDAIRTMPPSGFYSNWQTKL